MSRNDQTWHLELTRQIYEAFGNLQNRFPKLYKGDVDVVGVSGDSFTAYKNASAPVEANQFIYHARKGTPAANGLDEFGMPLDKGEEGFVAIRLGGPGLYFAPSLKIEFLTCALREVAEIKAFVHEQGRNKVPFIFLDIGDPLIVEKLKVFSELDEECGLPLSPRVICKRAREEAASQEAAIIFQRSGLKGMAENVAQATSPENLNALDPLVCKHLLSSVIGEVNEAANLILQRKLLEERSHLISDKNANIPVAEVQSKKLFVPTGP